MACRNAERAEAARAAVAEAATGPAPAVVTLDLADLASVRKAAAEVDGSVERLDVLMNNAGLMAPPLSRTADGFETQFGTNHLGHFALDRAAAAGAAAGHRAPRGHHVVGRPPDGAQPVGRPATTSTRPTGGGPPTRQSKLANLLFTLELGRRAAAHGGDLVAVAAHPGYAATHLQTTSAAADRWCAAVADHGRVHGAPATGSWPSPMRPAPARSCTRRRCPTWSPGDYFGPVRPVRAAGRPRARGHDRPRPATMPPPRLPVDGVRGAHGRHLRLVALRAAGAGGSPWGAECGSGAGGCLSNSRSTSSHVRSWAGRPGRRPCRCR